MHPSRLRRSSPGTSSAWKADPQAAAWPKAYEAMRAKYELVLPAPNEIASGAAATASVANP